MNLFCLLIGHRRSAKRAHPSSLFGWKSVCKYCGQSMVRLEAGKWCLEKEAKDQIEEGPVSGD